MIAAELSLAAAASALCAIVADRNETRPPLLYVAKPLTTLLILAAAATVPGTAPAPYRTLVLAALAFSLAGDICLMFRGDRWFIGGLGSFLVAHLLFVPAFLIGVTPAWPPVWSALFLIYAVALARVLLPRAGPLKLPVLVYMLALSAMALAAILRWQSVGGAGATRAMLGALVFVVSDSALGVRQFTGSYRYAQPLILATYWSAIALIAWSV